MEENFLAAQFDPLGLGQRAPVPASCGPSSSLRAHQVLTKMRKVSEIVEFKAFYSIFFTK